MGAGASKVSSGTVTVKLPTGAMIETTPTTDEAFASLTTGEVFGWLSSSPKIGTPCKMSLDKHFPGSLPGSAVKSKTASILYEKYGCVAKNTLYGQSICSDEINNEKGDLADLMKEYWGEVFPLGGIGGAPFVGKTGFMAFSHHVPDDGNVLILFGPHVGVTEDGEVGKYHRIGQKGNSTSCGAVIAAYQQCCGTTEMPFDMDDMQQSWLRQYIGTGRVPDAASTTTAHASPRASPPSALQGRRRSTASRATSRSRRRPTSRTTASRRSCCASSTPSSARGSSSSSAASRSTCRSRTKTRLGHGEGTAHGPPPPHPPLPSLLHLCRYEDHFQPKFFQVLGEGCAPVDLLPELAPPAPKKD